MKNIVLTSVLIVLYQSCAIHNGNISSSSINRNVTYVDIAYGVSQTSRVLGLGGLSQDALIYNAKCKLINERPLNPNEEYANFTLDFKKSNFIFYQQNKVTVTADVVKYINDTTEVCYSKEYRDKLVGGSYIQSFFSVGDTIITQELVKGKIVSFENDKKARIILISEKDKLKTKTVRVNKIYSVTKSNKGHKIGEVYARTIWVAGNEKEYVGKVFGIGINSMLVKFEKIQMQDNSKILPVLRIKY